MIGRVRIDRHKCLVCLGTDHLTGPYEDTETNLMHHLVSERFCPVLTSACASIAPRECASISSRHGKDSLACKTFDCGGDERRWCAEGIDIDIVEAGGIEQELIRVCIEEMETRTSIFLRRCSRNGSLMHQRGLFEWIGFQ